MPLYHQIFLQLREEITSGERSFGSRLPTEHDLSLQFGVSRITARRALDELADNDFVERRRRIGTIVRYRPPAKPFRGNIEQAVESLLTFGRRTQVHLLELTTISARAPIDEAMGMKEGTPLFRIERVRWLDQSPVGHFVTYIPTGLGVSIDEKTVITTPMLDLIAQAGIRIDGATQTISATLADAALAAALEVEIASPLLRVSRTVLTKGGRPVQHTLAHFRPDKYQIRLDLGSADEGVRML